MAIDLGFLLALLACRPKGRGPWLSRGKVFALAAATVCVAVPSGIAMASPASATIVENGDIVGKSSFVFLEPEKWTGKRFPLLNHIDIGEELGKGKWIVVLYDHNCPHCQAAMPQYGIVSKELAKQNGAPRVVLVEVPPYDGTLALSCNSSSCARGKLNNTREWFLEAPLELSLDNGVVLFGTGHGNGLQWFASGNGNFKK